MAQIPWGQNIELITKLIGDDTQVHEVTLNLCTNALHAMPYGGTVQIRLEEMRLATPCAFSRGQLDAGAYVRLSVIDSGVGIPSDVIDRIFDPYFTTKPQREGTGLGLSQVDGIVADFGGAIEVSSVIGTGTVFRIWLPVSSDAEHDGAIAHHMLIIGNEHSQKQEIPCGTNEAGRWLI